MLSRIELWQTSVRQAMLGCFLAALVATTNAASALDKAVVGVLRFTSSGPVFLALERGYFREAGLDVEVAFFQSAPAVATAAASRGVTFGVTALTAAFYNLAAEGHVRILAGQAQEKRGVPGNLILVTKAAHARGLDRLDELFDQPFGLTQLGSPSHYQLGQLAASRGFPVAKLDISAFQTLPNLVAALRSGDVTWAIIAPPIATDLIDAGAAVSLAPYSDFGSYQFGAAFASTDLIADKPKMVQAFLGAYRKGLIDYHQIVADPKSEQAREAARIVGQYVYPDLDLEPAADKVLGSAFYVDPTGRVDVADIERQIKWYFHNGMLKMELDINSILEEDLLK